MTQYPTDRLRNPGVWLGLSIVATLMCCWPLAVPGIVFAAQAMSAQGQGDVHRWENRVNKARAWTLWAIWLPVVAVALAFGAAAVTGALGESS